MSKEPTELMWFCADVDCGKNNGFVTVAMRVRFTNYTAEHDGFKVLKQANT